MSRKTSEAVQGVSTQAGFFSKAESLEKVDSRVEVRNVKKQTKDSRISKETSADAERYPLFCDEKAGLCSGEQGDKTRGLSPQRATNSLLYRAKPNP
ncbi:hypothetical protein [Helicobacter sp.]|uniref:hypothetical protein n=1 Tax=Helicobacter sp. TaxID=218 RepID=UPI00388D73C5